MAQKQTFLEKCYKDEYGKTRLFQAPNLPIAVWFVAMVLSKLITATAAHIVLSTISFGALFTWAWLELFSGVNYFRRALGVIVLFALILSRL